jgi:hypothetical protein
LQYVTLVLRCVTLYVTLYLRCVSDAIS